MKGFNLSTDYSKLWDLIHSGFRIPAWILYYGKFKEQIFDLVEVRMTKLSNYPTIGTRGLSYGTFEETKESFINRCESLQLKFIEPEI